MAIKDWIEAFAIFAGYFGDEDDNESTENVPGGIIVYIHPEDISEKHVARLNELGWTDDSDSGFFYMDLSD